MQYTQERNYVQINGPAGTSEIIIQVWQICLHIAQSVITTLI